MESRKVQKVGASTLSVSLPRAWVQENGLGKGDIVLFDNLRDGTLRILPPALGKPKEEDVEYVVHAEMCDEPGMLGRVVVGNYVIGRNLVKIKGKGRISSQHLQEVRAVVGKLHGLGIMTETADEIELQCSIDASKFPMESVIKRLYTIGSTMQKEAIEALERSDIALAKDAMGREDEADKMYWLALRLLLSAQTDPQLAEKIGIHDQLPIVGNRLIAKNLEHVADYADNVAQNVVRLLEAKAVSDKELVRLLRRQSDTAHSIVQDALACIFAHDLHLANRAIEAKRKVETLEEEILRRVLDKSDEPEPRQRRGPDAPEGASRAAVVAAQRSIAWSLRRIAEYGAEIAVIGINRYLERDSQLCHHVGWEKARRDSR